MCFFDLFGRQATRCSRGPRGPGSGDAPVHGRGCSRRDISFAAEVLWEDPGTGGGSRGWGCVWGWECGCSWGCPGQGGSEDGAHGGNWGYRNVLGQVLETLMRVKHPCVHGRGGLAAVGTPLNFGEHLPSLNHRGFGGVVPELSLMTPFLVSPPPSPLHVGAVRVAVAEIKVGGGIRWCPSPQRPWWVVKTRSCSPQRPGMLPKSTLSSPSTPRHPSGFLRALLGTELTRLQTLSPLQELAGGGSRT